MMNMPSVSFERIEQIFQQSNAKVLSLDCFDTLFWRNVSRPFDIFTRLQHGLCPLARGVAEADARKKKRIATGLEEVSLAEIYGELKGQFDAEQQQQMMEHELALEINNGFLFPPALALLRQAKARGIRTIIVSDTYLDAGQLSRLLAAHCDEIPDLIDHIYCSSEFGHSKSGSLWPEIVQREQVKPQDIFHVGDNHRADYLQPVKSGITAIHFKQNEALVTNVLEQRSIAAKLLFPACGATAPVPSLFHACYSVALRNEISSEQLTGWTTLGPILYAFALFIKQQRDLMPGVRLGFLMRDGYMLREAYHALYPDEQSASLNISRFTAIKSAFHSRQSIVDYLGKTLRAAERVTAAGFDMISRHLMLSERRKKKIASQLQLHNHSADYLYKSLLSHEVVKETLARSAACRQRLITHLQNKLQLQPGETLMLIDLGYAGTAQNLLAPLLEETLNIQVRGCYLIAAWTAGWQQNRTALVNPDTADFRLIRTLTRFIASFEMLCSSHGFSVVDYTDDGEPIGEGVMHSEKMISAVKAIQHEALRCVRQAGERAIPASPALWDSAAIDLVRYTYFPLAIETDLLQHLTFDINMGTDATQQMVDAEKAIGYMRRYGVARLAQDENSESRTNTPSELRHCGIEYSLSLLSASRNALSWSLSQSSQRQQPLEVLFIRNDQPPLTEKLFATSTFDGFFSIYIPMVTAEVVIAIGNSLRDFEVDSLSLTSQQALYKSIEQQQSYRLDKDKDYFIDGATQHDKLVLNMQPDGFIYVKPQKSPAQAVLHFVYRPLNPQIQAVND